MEQLTEKQIQEYIVAFKMFDKDGDGTITTKELGTVMKNLGLTPSSHELDDMIKKFDSTGDGTIDFTEFLDLMAGDNDEERQMREAFNLFDTDGSNSIDENELMQVMINLGETVTLEEVREMISSVDDDGSGEICFEEFRTLITKRRAGDDDEDDDDDEDQH